VKRLSSQLVWPSTVITVFDAGAEVDLLLRPVSHARLSLTRAQARRLAIALMRFVDKGESK
jgi:hypothetical protein